MGSEWREVALGDVCKIRRGSSPRPIVDFLSETEGMPWVKIADATESDSRFIEKTNQFIKEEGVCKSVIVEKGDLILSNSGTAGLPKFMSITACIHDGWQVLKDLDGITSDYLYYTLLYIRLLLLHNAYDSTMKNLTLDMVREAKVQLPPLPDQKAIAHILGTLDDKIELNRRMNATLEGMAQALFKSWFVDFDPVLDNAILAGNPIPEEFAERTKVRQAILEQNQNDECSVMNDELKDSSIQNSEFITHHSPQALHPTLSDPKPLFPAAFEFTDELGPIPKGWDARKLSEVATVTKGKSYKSSELQSSTTALVTLKSFNRGGGYRLDGLKEYTGTYKPEQVVESGDLIISYTDVTQAADVIGKPAMVIPDERYETLVISLDVGVVRPSRPTLKHFLYQLARTKRFEDWMLSHTSGTTVLHLSKNAFPSLECAFPDEELISEFEKIVSPLFERTVQNVKESRTLTKLRDALLPKLISGELRISEAEKLTEEALT